MSACPGSCRSQEVDLFGEIGGIAFSPDACTFLIAVADVTYSSLLHYQLGQVCLAHNSPFAHFFNVCLLMSNNLVEYILTVSMVVRGRRDNSSGKGHNLPRRPEVTRCRDTTHVCRLVNSFREPASCKALTASLAVAWCTSRLGFM